MNNAVNSNAPVAIGTTAAECGEPLAAAIYAEDRLPSLETNSINRDKGEHIQRKLLILLGGGRGSQRRSRWS